MTTKLQQLAIKLQLSDNSRQKRRQTLKQVLVWAWGEMSHEDRQVFLDRMEYPTLKFVQQRKITGDSVVDNALWQCRAMIDHFEGSNKDFLRSMVSRCTIAGFQPSKKQLDWYMRLFKQYKRDIDRLLVDAGVDLDELEVTE